MLSTSTASNKGTATAWIVSTVGPGNRHRKGLKKEVLQISIPEVCSDVVASKVWSLKITSNLMYGLTLIYKYKVELVLNDVLLMSNRLCKDLALLRFGKGGNINTHVVETMDKGPTRGPISNWLLQDDAKFDIDYDLCALFDENIVNCPNLELNFSSIFETSDDDDACSSLERTLQLSQLLGDQQELDFQFGEDGTEEISEGQKIVKSVTINENPSNNLESEPEFQLQLPDPAYNQDLTQITNELSTRLEPSSFFYRERVIEDTRPPWKKRKVVIDPTTIMACSQLGLRNDQHIEAKNGENNIALTSLYMPWLIKQAYKYVSGSQTATALDLILKPHEPMVDMDLEMEISRRQNNSDWQLQLDLDLGMELSLDLTFTEENSYLRDHLSLSPVPEEDENTEVSEPSDNDKNMKLMGIVKNQYENNSNPDQQGRGFLFSTLFPPPTTSRIEVVSFFSSTLHLATLSQLEITHEEIVTFEIATDFRLRIIEER